MNAEVIDSSQIEQDQEAEQKLLLQSHLHALSAVLCEERSEAIEARLSSGIETEWQQDEDHYEGIDDLNRGEQRPTATKPNATSGSSDNSDAVSRTTGSTIFPNITRPFVDASAARTGDMLCPVDDVAWVLNPTPVPQMSGIADGKIPVHMESQIRNESADDEQFQLKRKQLVDEVSKVVAEAREVAERAARRIQDWHIECQYHSEVRKIIEDCARIGTGILKGPIVRKRKTVAYKGGQLVVNEELVPESRRIDPWNFYPHGACGESVQNGSCAMDRDDITRKGLQALKGTPGYIDSQIDECLKEGPIVTTDKYTQRDSDQKRKQRDNKNLYDIWYYYGQIRVEDYLRTLQLRNGLDVDQLGEELDALEGEETVSIEATLVNDRIVRLIVNTIDTGELPYDVMVWQARRGMPWGIGVARQVRTAQRVFTAAWRNMMDNAGRASGPQIIWDPEYVEPAVGHVYQIKPWGGWQLKKSLGPNQRIDQVFYFLKADMYQAEMAAIIEMALSMAQEATGLPFIMQGQTDTATPDTLGGMNLQNNNASTVLRRIARTFDDRIIEPHVRRYYTYLLIYGEDNEKGDFKVDAKASSGLVERDMQAPILLSLMDRFQNPVFGKDPRKAGDEFLKSMRFDPSRFEYDDDKWEEVVQRMLQPPPDSALQVAQIREEGATARKQAELSSRENTEAFKAQVSAATEDQRQQFDLMLSQLEQDVVAYCEQNENLRNDNKIKGDLAGKMAAIRAQFALGDTEIAAPVAEPAPRAPAGQSYTK